MIIIAKRNRKIEIKIRVDEAEASLIREKMKVAHLHNREAYLRKMALDGYVIRLDLADVKKMVALLSNATNNLNQIARKANETGSVYRNDVKVLQQHYDQLWTQSDLILQSISKL